MFNLFKKSESISTAIDDWIVKNYGLGWSWVFDSLLSLLICIGAAYAVNLDDSIFLKVFCIFFFSLFAVLSVTAAIFAVMAWKFGWWNDRRTLDEHKKDHE